MPGQPRIALRPQHLQARAMASICVLESACFVDCRRKQLAPLARTASAASRRATPAAESSGWSFAASLAHPALAPARSSDSRPTCSCAEPTSEPSVLWQLCTTRSAPAASAAGNRRSAEPRRTRSLECRSARGTFWQKVQMRPVRFVDNQRHLPRTANRHHLAQIARQPVVARPRQQHGRRPRIGIERRRQRRRRHAQRPALRQHIVRNEPRQRARQAPARPRPTDGCSAAARPCRPAAPPPAAPRPRPASSRPRGKTSAPAPNSSAASCCASRTQPVG